MTRPIEERFWEKVDKGEDHWLWTRYLNDDGYGQFRVGQRMRGAHRVAYELTVGPIPNGMQVDHKCLTPACVRPDHLRLATNKQNQENAAGAYRNNVAGVRGVTWHKASGRWRARVRHEGREYHLGLFKDMTTAENAVVAKRLELFTFNELDQKLQESAA